MSSESRVFSMTEHIQPSEEGEQPIRSVVLETAESVIVLAPKFGPNENQNCSFQIDFFCSRSYVLRGNESKKMCDAKFATPIYATGSGVVKLRAAFA